MSRPKRKAPKASTTQIKEVQGPQQNNSPPNVGLVQLNANLDQKYLGSGFVGLDASLRVLSNASADDLLCQHGYELYRKMMLDDEVDADLTTLLNGACAQPIHFTTNLQPEEDGYRRSLEYADLLNAAAESFDDIDSWSREQMRSMLGFGNAVSEADWTFIEHKRSSRFVITDYRLQHHEHYGFIVDRWGKIYGVAPLGQAAGTLFPLGNLIPLNSAGLALPLTGAIPTYKLAIWTWEKRGTDPRGSSILASAYIPWWSKQLTIEQWSCWIGRYGQPSIVATPGMDASNTCDENGKPITPTQALLNVLRNFKNASALALPYGSQVDLLEAKGGADAFLDSIAAFNIAISRAILGQHLATGEGQSQSRSAAEVHNLVLRQTINALRYFKARAFKRDFIKPIIAMNYGTIDPRLMPVLNMGDGDGAPPTVTDIAVLLQSGYFTEDQLSKLDRMLGLPPRTTNIPAGPQAISARAKEENATDELAVTPRRSRSS